MTPLQKWQWIRALTSAPEKLRSMTWVDDIPYATEKLSGHKLWPPYLNAAHKEAGLSFEALNEKPELYALYDKLKKTKKNDISF